MTTVIKVKGRGPPGGGAV